MDRIIVAQFLIFGLVGSLVWLYLAPDGNREEPLVATIAAISALFAHFFQQQQKAKKDINYISVYERIFPYRFLLSSRLRDRHKFADVRGAGKFSIYSLKLKDIFVDLHLSPTSPDKVRGGLVPGAEKNDENANTIWYYLTEPKLKEHNFVILGPPGCGKTALLKSIILKLTDIRTHFRRPKKLRRIPLLLFLRNHAPNIISGERYTLADAIKHSIAQWGSPPPKNWVEKQLNRGKLLILLDGLDEVSTSQRQRIVNWVQQQINTYTNITFIITSRPHGFKTNILTGITTLRINDFNSQQVEAFIDKWYLANEILASGGIDERSIRVKARGGAKDLVSRIQSNDAMRDLSVNPLLLTIIATVHFFYDALPENRVELYAQVCQIFLSTWQKAHNIHHDKEFTLEQQLHVLRTLAFDMMKKHKRSLPQKEACEIISTPLRDVSLDTLPEEFLSMIQRRSGLIVEHEKDQYGFAHLTFQEYLAAEHIYQQRKEAFLRRYIDDSWWKETIVLYAARADATKIVEACLADASRNSETLILAIQCLDQAKAIDPQVRIKLLGVLSNGLDETDDEIRLQVLQAALDHRLRRLVLINGDSCQVDADLLSNGEYQLFLEQQEDKHLYCPDHWPSAHFNPGAGMMPVTGIRPTDAKKFFQWLNKREDPANWKYRLPRKSEFNKRLATIRKYQRTMPAEGAGYWVETEDGFEVEFDAGLPPSLTAEVIIEQYQTDKSNLQQSGNFHEIVLPSIEEAITSLIAALTVDEQQNAPKKWLPNWLNLRFSRQIYQNFCTLPTLTSLKSQSVAKLNTAKNAAQAINQLIIVVERNFQRTQTDQTDEANDLIRVQQEIIKRPRPIRKFEEGGGIDQKVQKIVQAISEIRAVRETLQQAINKLTVQVVALEEILASFKRTNLFPEVKEASKTAVEKDIFEFCCNHISQNNLKFQIEILVQQTTSQLLDLYQTIQPIVHDMISYNLTTEQGAILTEASQSIAQLVTAIPSSSSYNGMAESKKLARAIARIYLISLAAIQWQANQIDQTGTEKEKNQTLLISVLDNSRYLQDFSAFTLLEKRIMNEIPAAEGIRIVREKV